MRLEAFGFALLGAVLLMLVHHFGAFEALEQGLYTHIDRAKPPPARKHMPLVVSLDKKLRARWGPPPWNDAKWSSLSYALRSANIQKAYVLEPISRLYKQERNRQSKRLSSQVQGQADGVHSSAKRSSAKLLLPWLIQPWQLRGGARNMERKRDWLDSESPFSRWSAYIVPSRDRFGVWRDFHREGRSSALRLGHSAFCTWASKCPEIPLRTLSVHGPTSRSSIPMLSAVDLLDGHTKLSSQESQTRTVLLGFSEHDWSDRQTVGPYAREVSFVEGVAWVIASGRAQDSVLLLSPLQLALLCFVVLLLSVSVHRFRYLEGRARYLLAGSTVLLCLLCGLYYLGFAKVPLVLPVSIVWLPPMVSSLRGKSGVLRFLRQSARVILREGFRHAPVGSLIRSEDDLRKRLAHLSRTYTKQGRFLFFRFDERSKKMVESARFGVKPEEVEQESFHHGSSPWADAIASYPHGVWSDGFLKGAGCRVFAHALLQGERTVGVWCLVIEDENPDFDESIFRQVVLWLCDRLALEDPNDVSLKARLSSEGRIEAELDQLKKLVMAIAEERSQQFDTLQSLTTPLLVADLTGAALYVNRSLEKILHGAGIDSVGSMRELLFRLVGEKFVASLLPRLFLKREMVETRWEAPDGTLYLLRMAPIHGSSHHASDTITGFVAALEDLHASSEIRRVLREAANFSTARIRNDLMVVASALERTQRHPSDISEQRSDYDRMQRSIGSIIRMTRYLKAALDLENEENTKVPLDVTSYLRDFLRQVEAVGEARHVHIRSDLPFAPMHVLAAPVSLRRELGRLIERACEDTIPGGNLCVRVTEYIDLTEVHVIWDSLGIDGALITCFSSKEVESAPAELRTFFAAREVFPDLSLRGGPGEETVVAFSLARAH